jgi:hypothetical protein
MAALPARVEPTEAELRAAWSRCRRHKWPPTYEAAMADPVLSRLVRLNAKHPPTQPRLGGSVSSAPSLHRPAIAFRTRTQSALDRKRAAAGDRDDD